MKNYQRWLQRKNKKAEILIHLRQLDSQDKFIDWFTEFDDDEEILLAAVCCNGSLIRFGSSRIRGIKKIVLNAVTHSGSSLYHASKDLRNDEEVVFAAVTNDGMSLNYASNNMKNKKNIVLTAVAQNPLAFDFILLENLKQDIEVNMAKNRLYFRLLPSNEKIQQLSDLNFIFKKK